MDPAHVSLVSSVVRRRCFHTTSSFITVNVSISSPILQSSLVAAILERHQLFNGVPTRLDWIWRDTSLNHYSHHVDSTALVIYLMERWAARGDGKIRQGKAILIPERVANFRRLHDHTWPDCGGMLLLDGRVIQSLRLYSFTGWDWPDSSYRPSSARREEGFSSHTTTVVFC